MSQRSVPSSSVAEPVATYVVDSWDRLDQLPFAHRPGRFSVSYFPDELNAADTDAAFQQALAEAVVRGRPRWLEILNSEGGVVTAGQMGTLLGISRQAVDKRRRAGTLLGFQDTGREYLYPVWQVQDGKPLPGLERVLATLREGEHFERSQFMFFLSRFGRLWDHRPLDYLRRGSEDEIQAVVEATWTYLEQGGD